MDAQTFKTQPQFTREPPSPISSPWMPGKLSAAASDSLDLILVVAACAVMFGHLRTFFLDFEYLSHKSWPLEALYFFAGFGHQAVIVFFVLNGFLISSTVIRSHVLRKWSWRNDAVNRVTRFYVVFLSGLVLGFFWDRLGGWLLARKGIYQHPISDLGLAVPLNNLTLGTFLGNFLFLQTIFCQTFGSNGPLWSLPNEFWYYVLFPIALGAGLARATRRFRIAIPLTRAAVFIGVFLGGSILVGFLIWLSGSALVFLYSRFHVKSKIAALGILCFFSALGGGVSLVVGRVRQWNPLLSDLEPGFIFTLFLFAVLQDQAGQDSSPYSAFAHPFVGFSYSLYVLHFPFLPFLRSWLVPAGRWQPTSQYLLIAATLDAGSLLCAWLISRLTEAKTGAARKHVHRLLIQLAKI